MIKNDRCKDFNQQSQQLKLSGPMGLNLGFMMNSAMAAEIAFAGMDEWGELVNNVSAQEGILG